LVHAGQRIIFSPEAKLRLTDPAEDGKEAFRVKFKSQIKELIKREPRMSYEDGVWKIYYC
jgi:hypothetical protein